MSWIELIADRKIRDAQEEGKFDNLEGQGQPLRLDFDPRVPPEQRAAYRLMKEAKLLPDWIQMEKELRALETRWDDRLARFAARRSLAEGEAGSEHLDRQRENFLCDAARAFGEMNRLIDRLNLIAPASRTRARLNVAARVEELSERFPRRRPLPAGAVPLWHDLLEKRQPAVKLSHRLPLRRRRETIG
ncbi:MAG: DnaJ family domain-containing protein [Armatimonadota bacterium]